MECIELIVHHDQIKTVITIELVIWSTEFLFRMLFNRSNFLKSLETQSCWSADISTVHKKVIPANDSCSQQVYFKYITQLHNKAFTFNSTRKHLAPGRTSMPKRETIYRNYVQKWRNCAFHRCSALTICDRVFCLLEHHLAWASLRLTSITNGNYQLTGSVKFHFPCFVAACTVYTVYKTKPESTLTSSVSISICQCNNSLPGSSSSRDENSLGKSL